MSIRAVKAEYIIAFAIGVLALVLSVYGAYYLFAIVLPSGKSVTSLPLAIVGGAVFGVIMILKSYSIFIPIKKDSTVKQIVCPSCGALVDEDAEVCGKCKLKLEN
jgi:ribosomal protein L40E